MTYKKSFVTLVLIFALVFGLSTTAVFAHNTLPGDFFFPADIAAEKILLTISFGETENKLRLRFAEERLDEVRALLALASSVEVYSDVGTSTASTTESNEDNSQTSTTTASSTESSNVDPIEEEFLNNFDFSVSTVEEALLFALAHLEEAKAVFASKGNALGVASVNSFINELKDLADNHIAQLDRVSITIEGGDNDAIKIRILASSGELKTKFDFTKKTDSNGNTEQSIKFSNKDSKSSLKIDDDGKFKFNFNFFKAKGGHDDEEKDDDEDNDDDKGKKKNDKKVYICHKGKNTIYISKNARWAHILHGDDIGKCDEEDDEHDEDEDNDGEDDDTTAPEITNIAATPDVNSALTSWTTDENSTSKVWYSTDSPVTPESPTPFVNSSSLTQDHAMTLNSLTASTTYYYVVESVDEDGNTATSSELSFTTLLEPEPDDTTVPALSDIDAVASTTSAIVSWDTDEDANSVVWYSTATPVDTDTAEWVLSESLTMNHSLTIETLTASTTYYYVVTSTDSAGNTATSSETSFETSPEPEPPADTTAPEISGIEGVNLSSTTVTINWTTDENATGKVFYGTDNPLDTDTALSISVDSLTSDHSFDLSGLSASTTYQYIVVSSDESLNTATSSQQSFTTAE